MTKLSGISRTREKHEALLADLIAEKKQFGERWETYYDGKIANLKAAMLNL